jgi:hypothetical protein
MAIVSNTVLTYSIIGNREDLSDVIYNISPTETPMQAAFGKESAVAVYHEWQTDILAAAAGNAQLQGDDVAFAAPAYTVRVGNRTQISRKDVITSGTTDKIAKAGRKSEMVYQLAKKSKELRRDIEYVLGSNQAPTTGTSTVAQLLRPVLSWFATNVQAGTGGASGSTTTARTDGTTRVFSESLLQTAMQTAWVAGGTPNLALTGPKQRIVLSSFTGFGASGATKFDKTEDLKLYGTVGVYVSDFGEISFKPSRFVRNAATITDREVFILTTDLWSIATLRPMQTVDLAKTGDAEKAMILTEYTLTARNEAGSALIADLA